MEVNNNNVSKSLLEVDPSDVIKRKDDKCERGRIHWVVVLSGMYVMMLWGAFSRCYPVLYYPLMEDLEVNFEQVSTLSAWFFGAYAISGEYITIICNCCNHIPLSAAPFSSETSLIRK